MTRPLTTETTAGFGWLGVASYTFGGPTESGDVRLAPDERSVGSDPDE